MAAKKGKQGKIGGPLVFFHKIAAGIALIAFVVVIAAGLMAEASIESIVYRSSIVLFVVLFIKRIVLRAWVSFEEISRGKA